MNKFIIGLIIGIAIAGGLTFYLNNIPNQFVSKNSNNSSGGIVNGVNPIILAPGTHLREVTQVRANAGDQVANSEASEPTYDFYDILQGKNTSGSTNAKAPDKYYIQAGAFTNSDSANDMKAQLALLGFDSIIKAKQSNSGVVNRVIIGPLDSESEVQRVVKQLSENNITTTIIKPSN